MNKQLASRSPEVPGWYVCYLYMSRRPVVLYWGEQTTEWRSGAMKQNVVSWLGPLPE